MTIPNALSSPQAYPRSMVASPDGSIALRVGILTRFASSTTSWIADPSESTIGVQHSMALPSRSVAKRPESAGSRSHRFQMMGYAFIRLA